MRIIWSAIVSALLFSAIGCAMVQSPVNGFLYTDVKGPVAVTEAYGGSARGEACASSILGAVATGDASIDAAKKNGNIAQVTAIDHTASNILGIYAKYCLIVYGKRGAEPKPASQSPVNKG